MAVTKIWRVKGKAGNVIDYANNPDKTAFTHKERQALADVIEYAANEDKTEKKFFVSAVNCSVAFAKEQFDTTKKRFRKEDGTVAFHAYQSFAEGEATPEQAHEIGVALARELWGDNFQVIVATHLNAKCLHNHIIKGKSERKRLPFSVFNGFTSLATRFYIVSWLQAVSGK